MFPSISTSEWESRIIADLKGKDYNKALVWKTTEGISVKPYYRDEDLSEIASLNHLPGEFPFTRGVASENYWRIRQDIVVSDPVAANKKALTLLMKGVDSLGFQLPCEAPPQLSYLQQLLEGIDVEAAEINLFCPYSCCDWSGTFAQFIAGSDYRSGKVIASVASDPLSHWLVTGTLSDGSPENAMHRLGKSMLLAEGLPGLRLIAVNGKIYGNSGANVAQELAFSLAHAVAYLDGLTDNGNSALSVASRIKFNFGIGNNYFMEIAKLRAARLLWAHLMKAYGVEKETETRMMVHSETTLFNKTIYDAHTNLLRTQTEAMSASLGGAHSITVLPFDYLRGASEFSERIARNQQILLKEESHFDKVTDPAGGAYYLESLTQSLANEAWSLFLKVDEQGGFVKAVRAGFIQKEVEESAALRLQNYALRRENLVGVNQFPDFAEIIADPIDDGLFMQTVSENQSAEIAILQPSRGAAALEQLRHNTDLYTARGRRPVAFMLTIGNLTMRKARAQFACNFFAIAGFEVIDNNGFDSSAAGVDAARNSGADIIVVCSSDEEYATLVPEINVLLKGELLVVAGNPECRKELEAMGISNFIHVRSNLIQELTRFQQIILTS